MTIRSGADRHGLFSYDLRVWLSILLDVFPNLLDV
jgi:hypothetical protein